MEKLREFIIQRRNELRLSQVDLAERAGMSSATIAAIEAGRVTRQPRLDTLAKIEKGLSLPIGTLERILKGGPEKPLPDEPTNLSLAGKALWEKLMTLEPEKRDKLAQLWLAQLEALE